MAKVKKVSKASKGGIKKAGEYGAPVRMERKYGKAKKVKSTKKSY